MGDRSCVTPRRKENAMPFGMTLRVRLSNRARVVATPLARPGGRIRARGGSSHPAAQRLGEYLLAGGVIDARDVAAALAEQRRAGGLIGEILLAGGRVDAAALRLALAEQCKLPSLVPEYEALPVLPRDVAYRER